MDYSMRIENLCKNMVISDASAFVTEKPLDIRYFSGHTDPRGVLVIFRDAEAWLCLPAVSAEQARQTTKGINIQPVPLGSSLNQAFIDILASRNKTKGKILIGEISTDSINRLKKFDENIVIESAAASIMRLQRVKDIEEVENIRRAVAIAETGVKTAYLALEPGKTELHVAAKSNYAMTMAGAEYLWFSAMVISGSQSVFPDVRTSRRILQRGDMGFVDVGPAYEGYGGDLTRSFVLGKATADQNRLLSLTRETQQYALEHVRPGLKASDLYKLVTEYLDNCGMAQYFPHALGHGLGLLGACPPYLVPQSGDQLEVGDFITIEPGLYVPTIGGCRIEDVVIVTDTGYEPVSTLVLPWEKEI